MVCRVNNEWGRLTACAVGKTYSPSFYDWIPNHRIRESMQSMAAATVSALDQIVTILSNNGVDIVRPTVPDIIDSDQFAIPPMQPRNYMFMLGEQFYYRNRYWDSYYSRVKRPEWPTFASVEELVGSNRADIVTELTLRANFKNELRYIKEFDPYNPIVDYLRAQNNSVNNIDWADGGLIMRNDQEIFWGAELITHVENDQQFAKFKNKFITGHGHLDGIFCMPQKGLLIAVDDPGCYIDYESLLPDWYIYRLPNSTNTVEELRTNLPESDYFKLTGGRWWIPGAEQDLEMSRYIEQTFVQWFGNSSESMFDINMLAIDQNTVLTTSSQFPPLLEILDRHGITAHQIELSPAYFWDGGIHCMTADLNRQ